MGIFRRIMNAFRKKDESLAKAPKPKKRRPWWRKKKEESPKPEEVPEEVQGDVEEISEFDEKVDDKDVSLNSDSSSVSENSTTFVIDDVIDEIAEANQEPPPVQKKVSFNDELKIVNIEVYEENGGGDKEENGDGDKEESPEGIKPKADCEHPLPEPRPVTPYPDLVLEDLEYQDDGLSM